MAKGKSGRRKGARRAKFKKTRMRATGELRRIYKRKRKTRLRAAGR